MVKISKMCFVADNNLAIHTDGLSFFQLLKLHLIFHYTHLKDQRITNPRNPEKQLQKKHKSLKLNRRHKWKQSLVHHLIPSIKTKMESKIKKCSYNKSHQVNMIYAY